MDRFVKQDMKHLCCDAPPILSILVPVYNVEKYIGRCVESVLSQSFNDWELILVDDGSPDNSSQICDNYARKDQRIKVMHKRNEGLPSARLEGFRYAKGKYLVFLDSDDYLLPDALLILYNKVSEGYDMVRAGYRMVYSEDHYKDIVPSELGDIKGVSFYRKGLLCGRIDPFMWGAIYKKEVFSEETFLPVIPFSVGEDTITNYRVSEKLNNVFVLPDILYGYYMDWNSIMHQTIASHKYLNKMYLLMKSSLKKNEEYDEFQLRCYITAQHINYSFYNEVGYDKEEYQDYLKFIEINGTKALEPYLGRKFFVLALKIKAFHIILTKIYGWIILYHRWNGHKRKVIF